jgi:hypothetical protein
MVPVYCRIPPGRQQVFFMMLPVGVTNEAEACFEICGNVRRRLYHTRMGTVTMRS